ncbi:plasminogen-like [Lineus longissimus]|uniref:plasminogen-like n=1 Tax=Lineus longissimus TaxID=88925 RepID=UPI002B4EDAD7
MAWEKNLVLLTLVLAFAAIQGIVRKFDCLYQYQKHYTGQIAVTSSGYKCQRWDVTCPQSTSGYDDNEFPDGSKTAAANYCRNPALLDDHPWCFIDDPRTSKAWQVCNIPYCTKGTECTVSANGAEYLGKQAIAFEGADQFTCQRWDSQTPNSHWNNIAGGVDFNENTVKEVENYCRNYGADENNLWCYVISGGRNKFCKPAPICVNKGICSNPPTVENAIQLTPTVAGPYDHRATATYKCNTGYVFADQYDGVECLLTGKWTEKPTCNKVKCPKLQAVLRATVVVTGTADSYGTTVTYTCWKGYNLTSGDLTRECQSDKKWSGTAPMCTQIVAGKAPTVPGATVEFTTSTILGGVARYKCDKDQRTYDKTVNKNGQWEGDVCSGTPVAASTTSTTETTGTTGATSSCPPGNNTTFIAALSAITAAAFFTTLGLSIAVCKLKQAANSSHISQPSSKSPNATKPNLKSPPKLRNNAVGQSPAQTRAARPASYHNYYRDGY